MLPYQALTVCALTYGNYPELTARCLESIRRVFGDKLELRVGCNQVSPASEAIALRLASPGQCLVSAENLYKYPMMRRLFFEQPITTPWTMWFDDDSALVPPDGTYGHWYDRLMQAAAQADILGSPYTQGWAGNQREWVKAQPWYTGDDPALRPKVGFLTGGWWMIRTELLHRYNYPWPEIQHNGGDAMLGELCRQQGLRVRTFREHIWINADGQGRESKAKRRGAKTPMVGEEFQCA